MSLRVPVRTRLWLREAGAGWILLLALIQISELVWLGGLRERGRFVVSPNALLLAGSVPFIIGMWMTVAQYQARVLLSASELRVPRVLRWVCLTLASFAAWTILELLAPILILHGPYLQWLLFVSNAICLGVLVTLFRGTYLEMPILLAGTLVDIYAALGSSVLSTGWVAVLTAAMPLLIAWRLRVLIRVLRNEPDRDAFLRSLCAADRWRLPASAPLSTGSRLFQHIDRSASGVWRLCLGPLYERRSSWILLCFAPLPVMFLLARYPYAVAVAKLMRAPVLLGLSFLCGILGVRFFAVRVRRLAELLHNPSGEIADLALLPGLGSRRWQQRVLLREALVRPLFYYALCLTGIVVSCWMLLRLGQVQVDPVSFLVPAPSALLLLFAMMTVGVLSGRLGRDSAWFDRSLFFLLPPMLLALFADSSSGRSRNWVLSVSMWQNILWVSVFGIMAACLAWWAIQSRLRTS